MVLELQRSLIRLDRGFEIPDRVEHGAKIIVCLDQFGVETGRLLECSQCCMPILLGHEGHTELKVSPGGIRLQLEYDAVFIDCGVEIANPIQFLRQFESIIKVIRKRPDVAAQLTQPYDRI